jgi:hypothetical protein
MLRTWRRPKWMLDVHSAGQGVSVTCANGGLPRSPLLGRGRNCCILLPTRRTSGCPRLLVPVLPRKGHQITPAKPYAFCCGGWSEGQSGRVRTIAGVSKTKVAAGLASAGVGSGSEEVFVMMPAMALPTPGISVRRSSAINWSPQAQKHCPQRGSRPSPATDCRRARSVARIPAAVAAPGRR